MNNKKLFTEDEKFKKLSPDNQQAIMKLDECLSNEGYVFNGNWRDDFSSGGNNSSFELINKISDRKNLVTLRPMKNYLKVEVYWGFSKNIPYGKKPKQYYKMYFGQGVPEDLIDEVREFYNYFSNE